MVKYNWFHGKSFFFFLCRCEIVQHSLASEEFLELFENELPIVVKHDFLACSQNAYFNQKKESVSENEFVVTLDFSENYTCQVQDAIQSQHWSNVQATLHPYVVYYRKNSEIKNLNYVVISEKLHHDANAVHMFNSKLNAHLKSKFGPENVKKMYYFSDGAGSQYKNKYNLINLLNHEKDFASKAEWNFFATSHGKGACDGIGGTVKRNAFRSSLQNTNITSPRLLYEWAKTFFKKIKFDYCTIEEHNAHDEAMKIRYTIAKTLKNTRLYHSYIPIDDKRVACKIFSTSTKSVIGDVLKTRINKK